MVAFEASEVNVEIGKHEFKSYKGRRLIQTKIQEVDSRFSQRHQGLILADRLSMAMSIDNRDQIEILKYYMKFLTMQESFYFSVEIQKWKKYYENTPIEERPATSNSALRLFATLRHFQPFARSLPFFLLPPWEGFHVNALSLL